MQNLIVENIKKAVSEGNFNAKVMPNDHVVTNKERNKIILPYDILKKKLINKVKNFIATLIVNHITKRENTKTVIKGLENVSKIESGAIITCNHFGPIDNIIIRHFVNKVGKKLDIVVAECNFFMKGKLGWLLRNCSTIPFSENISYQCNNFNPAIKKFLSKKHFILIYPEQEMWLNYKKPRPPRSGAYHYAAKHNIPIIPTFIEMHKNNNNINYVLNIFPPIYPDKNRSLKENKTEMLKKDFELKVFSYEKAYNKKFQSAFEEDDIIT